MAFSPPLLVIKTKPQNLFLTHEKRSEKSFLGLFSFKTQKILWFNYATKGGREIQAKINSEKTCGLMNFKTQERREVST